MKKNGVYNFTLLELLTVIAVITLLISLLMPTLRNAREMARSQVCLNNLKQTGITLSLYATDFEGWLPKPYDIVTGKAWSATLTLNAYLNSGYDSLLCPGLEPKKFNFTNPTRHSFTYGMWAYNYDSNVRLWGRFAQIANIPFIGSGPSEHIIIADSLYTTSSLQQWYHIHGWVASERFFDLRHSKKLNCFFGDGHVAGIKKEDTMTFKIRYYTLSNTVFQNW